MASEIRVNKINNRAGLGTVEYTPTGIIVSGIVTCTEISGLNALNIAGVSTFASPLDINGDIDVDGHTNLDNVSIAGLSTHSEGIFVPDNKKLELGNAAGSGDLQIFHDSNNSYIENSTNSLFIRSDTLQFYKKSSSERYIVCSADAAVKLFYDNALKLETSAKGIQVGTGVTIETNGQATFTGVLTATSFSGDGSSLTGIDATKIITGNTQVQTIDTGSDGHIKFTTEGSEVARITASGHLGIGMNPTNDTGYLLQLDSGVAQTFMTFANSGSGNGALNGLVIGNDTSRAYITQREDQDIHIATNNNVRLVIQNDGHLRPNTDSTIDLGLTGTRFRNVYADTYYGDGTNLTNLPAGAPVGGASTNTVFFENDKAVAVNYQITSTKNAMSAGPIAINAGIAVTVPSGCSWTIV